MKKIEEVVSSKKYSQGVVVDEFESKLAKLINIPAENVVVVNNGTSALFLAAKILKKHGMLKEPVEVPATTFVSAWNVLHHKE